MSEVSLSLQKLDQAEECCRKALEIDPNDLTSSKSFPHTCLKEIKRELVHFTKARYWDGKKNLLMMKLLIKKMKKLHIAFSKYCMSTQKNSLEFEKPLLDLEKQLEDLMTSSQNSDLDFPMR